MLFIDYQAPQVVHPSSHLPNTDIIFIMEDFRDSLISKIDDVVSELYEKQHGNHDMQLQIEATVVGRSRPRRRSIKRSKFLLGKVDISKWRSSAQSPITSRSEEPSSSRPDNLPDQQAVTTAFNEMDSTSSHLQHDTAADEIRPRRKTVGGLRIGANDLTPPRTPSPSGTRQLATDQRSFPKRRRLEEGPPQLQPSNVDKLIEGIWEQIHKPNFLVLPEDISKVFQRPEVLTPQDFADVSRRCRTLTGVSQTTRSLEIMMQAHWVDCYYARIDALADQRPDLKPYEHKKVVMTEACSCFEWSEKDLRNRMAVWKGYQEIKDAAGWAALAFASPGIYRLCKYRHRMGFDQDAIAKLQVLQSRFEVAADTIQPQWRKTLTLVGVPDRRVYRGHPHDWVVGKRKDPVPLPWTYRQWDTNFSFIHLNDSVIDTDAFGSHDPRRIASGSHFCCSSCSKVQSEIAEKNECDCYLDLFGPNARSHCPVQVFRTDDGRNNGLIACCSFERGAAVGEFVGLVTKGLEDMDVMQCEGMPGVTYQIWQGRKGNFTRFINHSCLPNCQFETFVWLRIQRTIVVSKGVTAGQELTIDYSDRYWQKLDKTCLCKQAACRYRDR